MFAQTPDQSVSSSELGGLGYLQYPSSVHDGDVR